MSNEYYDVGEYDPDELFEGAIDEVATLRAKVYQVFKSQQKVISQNGPQHESEQTINSSMLLDMIVEFINSGKI